MDARNIASVVRLTAWDEKRLVTKRLQRGECPACATRLFRFGLLGKKILISERVTNDGSCLKCFLDATVDDVPRFLEVVHRRQQNTQKDWAVDDDDAKTMVSGITLPFDLTMAAKRAEANSKPTSTPPLMTQDENFDNGNDSARNGQQGHGQVPESCLHTQQNGTKQPHGSPSRRPIQFTPPPQLLQQMTLAAVEQYTHNDDLDSFLSIKWEPSQLGALREDMTASSSSGPSLVDPHGQQQQDVILSNEATTVVAQEDEQADKLANALQPQEIYFYAHHQSDVSTSEAEREKFDIGSSDTAGSIQGFLRVLSSPIPRRHTLRVAALKGISDMILDHGVSARLEFGAHDGLETIASEIWSDINDEVIQEAALTVLFALVGSEEIETLEKVWVGEPAQSCIDALLVAMQTLLDNATIQSIGCKILGCLAKTSSNNVTIIDGSLSGALWSVFNAMKHHDQSMEVQDPGIRCICAYCVVSSHAESNMCALFGNSFGDGAGTTAVMKNALKRSASSPSLCECLCEIYRRLPALQNDIDLGPQMEVGLKGLLSIIARYYDGSAGTLLVTAVAAAADLLAIKGISNCVDPRKLLALAFDILQHHAQSYSIQREVLRLIANFCASSGLDEEGVVEVTTVQLLSVYDAMLRFPTSASLQRAALEALRLLATRFMDVRNCLLEPILYAKLMQLRSTLLGSSGAETSTCRLIACMADCTSLVIIPVISDLVEYVLSAVSRHPSAQELTDAAAFALSKIVRHNIASNLYVPITDVALDIAARCQSSVSVQSSCCCIISAVLSHSDANDTLVERRGRCMEILLQAIRSHSSTDSILHPACSALHTLLASSQDLKDILLSNSSEVVLISGLVVMCSKSPELLFKVMAILAIILDDFPDDSRLSDIVDDINKVMCEYIHETCLFSTCMTLLCRIVVAHPNQRAPVARHISTVIEAMSVHYEQADLLEAACQFLAVMSHERQTILDSGGDLVLLMLADSSEDVAVRRAAHSACMELGLEIERSY